MATKATSETLKKVADDEPIFVLRGQDRLASVIVREWAGLAAMNGCPDEKVKEAYDCAEAMDNWPTRKLPD